MVDQKQCEFDDIGLHLGAETISIGNFEYLVYNLVESAPLETVLFLAIECQSEGEHQVPELLVHFRFSNVHMQYDLFAEQFTLVYQQLLYLLGSLIALQHFEELRLESCHRAIGRWLLLLRWLLWGRRP